MVRFGTENALSQKGTGARRENTDLLFFFRLGLTPSFLAAHALASRGSRPRFSK